MNIQSLPDQKDIEQALGLDGRSRRKTWFRRLFWLVILGCAIAGGVWWYGQQGAATAVTYTTEPVNRADLVIRVQATGKIQPTTQVDVSSEMSGVIRLVNVDNKALLLRPGMTATAQIVVREIPGALAVPNAALRYEPPKTQTSRGFSLTSLFMPRFPRLEKSSNKVAVNGERTLYVLVNGSAQPVSVKTGASDGQLTEIVSGDLKAGDLVISDSKQGQP